MSQIHAPYHFVPLSKWVYMPDWAHLVSHDVPFEDGLSGTIEYTLTNHTPLCVGDKKDEQGRLLFAKNPLNQPVIPASSLKGMIRSVLEIASFGKFSSLDDDKLAFRDISSAKGNYLTNVIGKNTVKSGWIQYDQTTRKWYFTPANFCKVSHKAIKQSLNVTIKNDMTAIEKYDAFPINKTVSATISEPRGKQKNCWAENLSLNPNSREVDGHLFFTNMRIVGRGDKENYEFSYFVYPDKQARRVQLERQVQDLFKNHTSIESTVNKKTYNQVEYLQQHQHPDLGIPVFALCESKTNNVRSLGFARMPRVSYKNSMYDMVSVANKAHISGAYFDMAELMFGTLRENALSLKSRVMFNDALGHIDSTNLYYSNLVVLSSPKSSFYPVYVEQRHNEAGVYKDYDQNSPLSGHKRYISKIPSDDKLESNAKDNLNVAQQLELCPKSSQFKGKIVFHNLKPMELGALLWCLELQDGSFHQLGHGKPMGAGVVKVEVDVLNVKPNSESEVVGNIQNYMNLFISQMTERYPAKDECLWLDSPQLKYLLTIGDIKQNEGIDTSYMSIDNKEFQNAKTNYEKLPLLHGLNRLELAVVNKKATTTAFTRGRLASLFDAENEWQKEQKLQSEQLFNDMAEQALVAEKAKADEARKANMSEHEIKVDELREMLGKESDKTQQPPLIRDVLSFFEQNIDKSQAEAAKSFVQLARQYEFHQRPKKSAKEQKAQLAQLQENYGFTL